MIKRPEIVLKSWGRELIAYNSKEYCGKKLELKFGHHCSLHRHPKLETFMLESGQVRLVLERLDGTLEFATLEPDDCVDIPRGRWHCFWGAAEQINRITEYSTTDCESERFCVGGYKDNQYEFENWLIEQYSKAKA